MHVVFVALEFDGAPNIEVLAMFAFIVESLRKIGSKNRHKDDLAPSAEIGMDSATSSDTEYVDIVQVPATSAAAASRQQSIEIIQNLVEDSPRVEIETVPGTVLALEPITAISAARPPSPPTNDRKESLNMLKKAYPPLANQYRLVLLRRTNGETRWNVGIEYYETYRTAKELLRYVLTKKYDWSIRDWFDARIRSGKRPYETPEVMFDVVWGLDTTNFEDSYDGDELFVDVRVFKVPRFRSLGFGSPTGNDRSLFELIRVYSDHGGPNRPKYEILYFDTSFTAQRLLRYLLDENQWRVDDWKSAQGLSDDITYEKMWDSYGVNLSDCCQKCILQATITPYEAPYFREPIEDVGNYLDRMELSLRKLPNAHIETISAAWPELTVIRLLALKLAPKLDVATVLLLEAAREYRASKKVGRCYKNPYTYIIMLGAEVTKLYEMASKFANRLRALDADLSPATPTIPLVAMGSVDDFSEEEVLTVVGNTMSEVAKYLHGILESRRDFNRHGQMIEICSYS